MQNLIAKIQDIIRSHYGYSSEWEWRPSLAQNNLLKETYSPIDGTLSIPIYEPRSRKPLAYFKIMNVAKDQDTAREKIRDLIQISLQSYVDLMDQLEITDNLLEYLQVELSSENVIRMVNKTRDKSDPVVTSSLIQSDEMDSDETSENKEALLLKSNSPLKLERLALSIHAVKRNHFFLRSDHMDPQFLNSINDLSGLQKTTLYIPQIERLTLRQQKTLETHLLMKNVNNPPSVLFIAGTTLSLGDLVHVEGLSKTLMRYFDFFYVLSETAGESEIQFESLNQCAHAVLQSLPSMHLKHHKFSSYTKSCHLIPSCQTLFPTIH